MGGCVGGGNKKPLQAKSPQEQVQSPDRNHPRTDVAVKNGENNVQGMNEEPKLEQMVEDKNKQQEHTPYKEEYYHEKYEQKSPGHQNDERDRQIVVIDKNEEENKQEEPFMVPDFAQPQSNLGRKEESEMIPDEGQYGFEGQKIPVNFAISVG